MHVGMTVSSYLKQYSTALVYSTVCICLYVTQYTSWLGDIKQTYKAVSVEFTGEMHSRKHSVRLTDQYLLQPHDERCVLRSTFSFAAFAHRSALKLFRVGTNLRAISGPHPVHCRSNRCRPIFLDRRWSNSAGN